MMHAVDFSCISQDFRLSFSPEFLLVEKYYELHVTRKREKFFFMESK